MMERPFWVYGLCLTVVVSAFLGYVSPDDRRGRLWAGFCLAFWSGLCFCLGSLACSLS